MTKISVVVPVYNAEEFLTESINSVLNQTLTDIEVICVNDGSKDNSLAMLNNIAKKDGRLKVIDKPNGGCGSARNKGIDYATGKYIYFFDPDDYIVPDAFEKLYNNAENNQSDMVLSKIARYVEGKEIDYSIPGFNLDELFKDVDFENYVFNYKDIKNFVLNASFAPWTKLYRREFIEKYKFRFDLNVAFDDVPFHVKTMLKSRRISFVPQAFYHYRISNPNSVNNTVSNAMDIMKICNLVEAFLEENNYFPEFNSEFSTFKITQILYYIIFSNSESYFKYAQNEFNKIDVYKDKVPEYLIKQYNLVINSKNYNEYRFKRNVPPIKDDSQELRDKVFSLENESNKKNEQISQLKGSNNSLKTKNDNLSKNNQKLQQQLNQLNDIISKSKESSDIKNILDEINENMEELTEVSSINSSYLTKKIEHRKSIPLISIILPSYNVKKYIYQCIDSVVKQTLKNIEIICVDAGSTDGTLDIINEMKNKDSRIKVIISDKKSYGHQMNLALKEAKGKYIGIVETDDYVADNMFESLYNLTENESVDIAKANFYHITWTDNEDDPEIFADGTKKHLPEGKFRLEDDPNIMNGHPSIWAGIYRREFLSENNVKFIEAPGGGWVDNPFLFETFCLAKSIKYQDKAYYYYRESNPDSSTNKLSDINLPMIRMMDNLDVLEKYNQNNENVLHAVYIRVLWHIKDISKKDIFSSKKHSIYIHFQNVVKRLDKNVIKKYFNKEDQKIFEQCYNYSYDKINLLMVASDNNKTSGAFLSMSNLCVYLRDKYGVNVKVIVPMHGHGEEVLNKLNISYDVIESRDWVVPLSKVRNDSYYKEVADKKEINKKAIKKLTEYIKQNDIDIIHINTTYSYVAAKAGENTNTPVVWHLREFLEEDQSNTLWDRKKGNELINKSNKIIAISNSIYDKYANTFDKDKLVCIYNGIDAERFYKKDKNIFEDKTKILLMVGGFEDYKGQLEFAEACVKLNETGRSDFKIWFVGLGNEKIRNQVKQIFKDAGMVDKVTYWGYKYDVENYYEKADISFTCAKSEAFGRTTVECMLSGNLIIGADTAGTKELIKNKKTGLLYKQGNTDDLKNNIEYALDNPKVSKKIAKEGRKYMFENMTAEINADNIYNLYQTVISKN